MKKQSAQTAFSLYVIKNVPLFLITQSHLKNASHFSVVDARQMSA